MHFEVAGLMNRFSFYNSINNRYCSITGGGALNALLETARHLTFVTSNFYTNGGSDFIFGGSSGSHHSSDWRSIFIACGIDGRRSRIRANFEVDALGLLWRNMD
jgi:hypothetical protein